MLFTESQTVHERNVCYPLGFPMQTFPDLLFELKEKQIRHHPDIRQRREFGTGCSSLLCALCGKTCVPELFLLFSIRATVVCCSNPWLNVSTRATASG